MANGRVMVREVDARLRRALEQVVPELGDFDRVAIVATQGGRLAGFRALIGQLTPAATEVLPAALVAQARRNAEARLSFLTEFGAMSAEQVADLAGSKAKNRHETASRLKREGRVFAVEHEGLAFYPAFQFDTAGRSRPAVAQVLAASDLDGWELALWFATPNGWLDQQRPVDLLDGAPEQVVGAAAEDRRGNVF